MYQVAFGTATDGYALVHEDGHLSVAHTTDGGRLWALLPGAPNLVTPPGDEVLSGQLPPPVVEANGPSKVVAYEGDQVAASSDGGHHWQDRQLPGPVRAATTVGDLLWALVQGTSSISPPYPPPPAPEHLYVSTDDGATWEERSTLPRAFGPYMVLVSASPAVAYALAPGEDNSNAGYYGGLVRTADGGRHWEKVVSPCSEDAAPRFFYEAELSVVSPGQLWMACSEGPRSGFTLVFRSSDAARSWSQVAGTAMMLSGPNFPTGHGLALAGWPATSAFGAGYAWLVLTGPSLLVGSSDGGRTWVDAAPKVVEEQGPQQVFEVDGTVIVRTTDALWRSSGGRWHEVISA